MKSQYVEVRGARLLAGALVLLLSACAGTGGRSGDGQIGASGQRELQTSSDLTAGQKRADIRIQLAIEYYQQGRNDIALDEVKQALVANPEFADAYGLRGLIYMAMGEKGLAEDNFQRAIKLAPDNPDLANNYGFFLCQNGRAPQSLAYFDQALHHRLYQAPVRALNNAGACSQKAKDIERAERYLLEALRLDAEYPMTNANLARVYFEKRDMDRAAFFINRLRTGDKLDSLTADALWLAIRVEHKLGNKEFETQLVTQLRRRFPTSAEFTAFQRGAFDE